MWQQSPYAAALILATGLLVALAHTAWRRRQLPQVRMLALVMMAAAVWTVGYAFELISTELSLQLFLRRLASLAAIPLPTLWLVLIVRFSNRDRRVARWSWIRGWLWVEPVAALVMVWTNGVHHLFHSQVWVEPQVGFVTLGTELGPIGWVHESYSLFLFGLTTLWLLQMIRHYSVPFRSQIQILLAAGVMLFAASLLYLLGFAPVNLDVRPGAWLWAGLISLHGVFRYRLFDIVPTALDSIVENMSDGVLVLDVQGRIVDLNPAAEQIVCNPRSALVGKVAISALPQPLVDYLQAPTRSSEVLLPCLQGIRCYDAQLSSLSGRNGDEDGQLLVLRDVTERKRVEDALLHERDRAQQYLDIVEVMLIAMDETGTITLINRKGCNLLGYQEDELLGQNWFEACLPESAREEVWHLFTQIMAAELEPFDRGQNPVVTKSGEQRLIAWHNSPLTDETGAIIGMLSSGEDITELALAEQELGWRAKTLEALHQTALDLAGQWELPNLLEAIAARAVELLQAQGSSFWVYRPATDDIQLALSYNLESDLAGLVLQRGEGLAGKVLDAARPMVVSHYSQWDGRSAKFQERNYGAMISVPVYWGDQPMGVLNVLDKVPRTFSPADTALLSRFAPLAAAALTQARLLEEARTRLQEAETLRQASATVTKSLSLDNTLTDILEQLGRVVVHDSASVQLLREDYTEVVAVRGHEVPESAIGQRYPIPGDNPNTTIVREKRPLILDDVAEGGPAFQEAPCTHIRSWLGVPLLVRNKVIGMLAVDSVDLGHFNQEHIRQVIPFADQAAIAIDNAQLYQQVHQRAEELGVLYEVVSAAMTSVHLEVIFDRTLETLHRTLPVDCSVILLTEGEELVTKAWAGFPEDSLPLMRRKLGVGVPGWVAQHGEALLLGDVRDDRRYHRCASETLSEVCVPLRSAGRIIGALNLESYHLNAFDEDDLRLLSILAGHLSAVVDNARLVEELEGEVRERTAEIVAEQEKSEVILHNVGNAIAMCDAQMRIRYVNPEFIKLTGYQPQSVLGQELDALVGGVKAQQDRESYRYELDQGQGWGGELTLQRQDGRLYNAMMTIAPINNAAGTLTGYVSSHEDISQLKELDDARNQFMTNISHQLRTPVTNMKLYAHLLRSGRRPEKTEHYLGVLEQQSDRLAHLIEDILEMTALDGGGAVTSWTPVFLTTLVSDVVVKFARRAEDAGLLLITSPTQADMPVVYGDVTRLGQALEEVVENAINFTPVGGKVTVALEAVEQDGQLWVTIAVSDTGPGISLDEQEHIFERFFRGKVAESGQIPGTGLGLSMAQQIVQAHGGRLTVESLGVVGRGVTFTFWLRGHRRWMEGERNLELTQAYTQSGTEIEVAIGDSNE